MLGSTKQPQKCWKRAVHGSFLGTITHVKHVPKVYTALAQMAYEMSKKDCDYTSRIARVLSKATYSVMTGRSVESWPVYGRFPGDNYPCRHMPRVSNCLTHMADKVSRKDNDFSGRTARLLSEAAYSKVESSQLSWLGNLNRGCLTEALMKEIGDKLPEYIFAEK